MSLNSPVGPFDRWANGLGFDYFYGFNGGDMAAPHEVKSHRQTEEKF